MKRLLLFFILTGYLFTTSGCSSSSEDKESGTPEAEASAEIGEEADFAEEGGEEGGDEFAEEGGDEFADEGMGGDGMSAEGGDEFAEGDEFADEGMGGEVKDPAMGDASEELALDEGAAEEAPAENMAAGEEVAEPMMDDPGVTEGSTEDSFKSWIPVKKIAESPFTKAGVLVNAVYIARPGDDVESISQKIYGSSDRAEELYSINTTLRNRGVKTGDKVYYNSPQRPTDDSRLLVFYEDVGLQAETYIAQPGDNIRQVSKSLLGDNNSWKEVWATNLDVESKSTLSEGTQLRYWASTSVPPPSTNLARNDVPPPPPSDMGGDMNDIPPPPPPDMAMNDIPPPPPPPPDMGGDLNDIPPPPPPDMAMNDIPPPPPPPGGVSGGLEPPPPPPAPPGAAKKADAKNGSGFGSDPDETMALGAAAIILLAVIALIVMIRKRKQRQALADFANTQTHTQIE
ncbi:MAG: hypothetical protein KDD58_05870 [Bdellovibrionales bacterium]|nr:hypothetical protein [Bdellovibrionales bacterium]